MSRYFFFKITFTPMPFFDAEQNILAVGIGFKIIVISPIGAFLLYNLKKQPNCQRSKTNKMIIDILFALSQQLFNRLIIWAICKDQRILNLFKYQLTSQFVSHVIQSQSSSFTVCLCFSFSFQMKGTVSRTLKFGLQNLSIRTINLEIWPNKELEMCVLEVSSISPWSQSSIQQSNSKNIHVLIPVNQQCLRKAYCILENLFVLEQTISFVSQSFMLLSVDPPPVAKSEFLWGDQANAFTAAVCQANFPMYLFILGSQTKTRLSFPPDAIKLLSADHFSPHIYCLCPQNLLAIKFALMSQIKTSLSLDPVATRFQLLLTSMQPTLPKCSLYLKVYFFFYTSIALTLPVSYPINKPFPHFTQLIYPQISFQAQFPFADQMYAELSRTTLIKSCLLQSSRLVQKSSLSLGASKVLYELLGSTR